MKSKQILNTGILASLVMLSADAAIAGASTLPSLTAAELSKTQVRIIVDRSMSMTWKVGGNNPAYQNMTRWDLTMQLSKQLITNLLENDANGEIEICFVNLEPFSPSQVVSCKTPDEVAAAFAANSPKGGGPNCAAALAHFFGLAKAGYSTETPENSAIIIFTDGGFADIAQVKDAFRTQAAISNQPKDEFCYVEIIQVGHDAEAEKTLKDMDDGIAVEGQIHDIVDTTNIEDIGEYTLGQLLYKAQND